MMKRTILCSILALGLAGLNLPLARAQDMDAVRQAIEDALPGTLIHDPLDMDWDSRGRGMKLKIVEAPELSSGQAVSVKIKKRAEKRWDNTILLEMDKEIKRGDNIQVHFWARTVKPAAGKETAEITLFIGRSEEPYDYVISEKIFPETDWKMLTIDGVAETKFKAGRIKAEFQLGAAGQTIEFGPIYVSNLGGGS
jgi:hypothetical protein